MEAITNWVSANFYISIAFVLMFSYVLATIIFIVVIVRLNRLARQYKILMRGIEGKNIEDIVLDQSKILEQSLQKIDYFESRLKTIERLSKKSLQKVNLLRFNAFHDMGGDLSFSLALLNQNGDGVVLSSIYGREDGRIYAKSIKKGESAHLLSAEEQKVIETAMQER